ncbi:uncharacterized protein NECHADRAFT_86736 [Fusarium vanettenii 77-13-4]|uniref:Fungal STAND N-terminal Goodbye domain-containing protein n=1 Tax=Fusarium vanettenii (strain ATCC MYA-4622 / CBS 123669 / FGSC 9596 / NRRL 45880 / 77-13-4) TaxID=660122 RepID=C7ZFV2_FUSV7|nr:uncharacterized protein NECHADRAFT_86736 [Fusarium vanettenii 77-13-4]EEU37124.1 hypothetical protein NECHADRAFT_86736 [Fusarium vanettenii 77-13-4]
MEPQIPVLDCQTTLTNSAAKFTETRARDEGLPQFADSTQETKSLQDSSEFINEIDRFVPKDVVFDPKETYQQSQQSLETFRRTLQRLIAILRERNVDTQLNIDIKDPSDFTCEYVLQIINKIRETRESATKTRSCKNFVRRCYQKIEDNRSAIEGFLTMIPNDAYGSVISGGFAMIMAAVEKRAEHREAIQNFLAEIPERLETIQRLSQIHHASIRLHRRADAVMVAVFTVLERIVDKITKARKVKLQDKAKSLAASIRFRKRQHSESHNDQEPSAGVASDEDDDREQKLSVVDALADLQNEIDNFQKEVDICNQERLGSMQVAVGDLGHGLRFVMEQNSDTQTMIADSLKRLENMVSQVTKEAHQALLHHLEGALYKLCASDPNFKTKMGEVDYYDLNLSQQENDVVLMSSRQQNNTRIASEWRKKLRGLVHDPMKDMKDCLKHIELLDSEEKNVSHSILHSEQLGRWLQGKQSTIIDINLHTPPASLHNPLSFISALSATALRSTAQFPVLAFFCAHRSNESLSEEKSGPTAPLVRSLVGQLLRFISDHRPSADLGKLQACGLFSKARKSLKEALKLFASLLLLLPEGDMVFLIIDSLSRLSGGHEDKMTKKLVQIVKQREDILIKVMTTDALPSSYIRNAADISLYIPDLVIGPGVVDISRSSDKIVKKVKQKRHLEDGDGDVTDDDGVNDNSEKDDDAGESL